MWKKIYTQALPLVVLLAPALPVSMSFRALQYSAYPLYLLYFLCFYTLLILIVERERVKEFISDRKPLTIGWYGIMLLAAGGLITALEIIRNGHFPDSVFYSCLASATLLGLRYSLDSQRVFFRSVLVTLVCYLVLLMTGFEALGYHYYPATSIYSFAIAAIVTGQYIVSEMMESAPDIKDRVRKAKTRNQRRKWKRHAQAFSNSRPTRLTAGILLVLGPIVIATMAMTPLFESRFMLVCLSLLPARSIMNNLLPTQEAIEFPDDFLFRYTGICYLFVAMIPLLKFFRFL